MTNDQSLWQKMRANLFFKIGMGLIALFVLILLFDKVIMPWYVRLGDEVELPDVVEMTVQQASDTLNTSGFIPLVVDSVYDANFPAGTVVEQNPPPYSVVKTGRHVYLTVSIGEKPIRVPNLFYKSPRDAQLLLESEGLQLGQKFYEYSEMSLAGVVISQSYPPGQIVKKGTPVDITISLGPLPKQKKVPDLVGKSLDAAKKQLKLLGVKNISVEYVDQENILPETVVWQSIASGTPIKDDMEIVLRVSKIKQIEENQ